MVEPTSSARIVLTTAANLDDAESSRPHAGRGAAGRLRHADSRHRIDLFVEGQVGNSSSETMLLLKTGTRTAGSARGASAPIAQLRDPRISGAARRGRQPRLSRMDVRGLKARRSQTDSPRMARMQRDRHGDAPGYLVTIGLALPVWYPWQQRLANCRGLERTRHYPHQNGTFDSAVDRQYFLSLTVPCFGSVERLVPAGCCGTPAEVG